MVALEVKDDKRSEEIKWLHQDIIWVQEQQIDLQSQAEDLENRSRWNNICIPGVPTASMGYNLGEYVDALFRHMPVDPGNMELKLDLLHHGSGHQPASGPPVDILVCVHDFEIKESILLKALDQHPLHFLGHMPMLYQDLVAIILQKTRNFKPVTAPLKKKRSHICGATPFGSSSDLMENSSRSGRSLTHAVGAVHKIDYHINGCVERSPTVT
ncbi:hypothetical protein NDU88_005755 [Pleurodeles waltl]|uniref:Uncharacterized protein n=1 Tax=Pleurodeles waltl TaxID=8319 RepID=A0AAV7N135_PLEWA|nr:hypothetical protein NDU88_005755 [Pleurodeles waltl]